ncbi:MAG: KEOPS complex kinase/ATPase Bud32 [Candidatus Micrarchaeia archaeon]|jgi:TP53 regulating kinase-like protein
MNVFGEGAEAKLYECTFAGATALRKVRGRKKYRVYSLDTRLRAMRTRREAKILHAAKMAGVRCPLLFHADLRQFEIIEEYLPDAALLRQKLGELPSQKQEKLMRECGGMLGRLHLAGIVHGDFTTSNVMLGADGKIFFIDFGLADFSQSEEERAIDLLLFKKSVSASQFGAFLAGYSGCEKGAKKAVARLAEVLLRGRYVARQGADGGKNGAADA